MLGLLKTLAKYTLVSFAVLAIDNQTGIFSKLAGRIPVVKDLVLPTVNKD